jgi:response regulator RpfG family c-di-GMP phosphodiesterase
MYKGRVLIVDDDPFVRESLSEILCQCDCYETDVALDGLEGIEKVRSKEYDIVFTDLCMPRLNGIDFLKEIKKLEPTLPVVIITGFSTIENAINAMREGASDFIEKPFQIEKVVSVTEKLICQRKLLGKIAPKGDYRLSLERVNAELLKRLQEIATLHIVSTELDNLYDNREIYQKIVEMALKLLMVREASFGIVDGSRLKIKSSIGTPVNKEVNITGTYIENIIKSGDYFIAQPGGINPFNNSPIFSPILYIPLTINDETIGILSLSNKLDGTSFTDDEIHLALTFGKRVALRIENNTLYETIYNNLINTLKSLVSIIEARDPYTKQHSERVTAYALEIAELMNLSYEEKEIIKFGGYLHDIGKIGVRDTVLLKPGRLTPEEMAEVKLHPIIGDNMVKPIRFLQKERELILYHHERIDGRGYPYGIGDNEIPLTVRVLSVADVYDAITSSRAYRPAKSHEVAIEELKLCINTQFDRDVVQAFLETETGKGKLDKKRY